MNQRRRRETRSTGVTLEVVVIDYLRALSQQQERDRSFCINAIVREHAERHGHPLPLPTASAPSSPPGER
jgi:hypothetical protein